MGIFGSTVQERVAEIIQYNDLVLNCMRKNNTNQAVRNIERQQKQLNKIISDIGGSYKTLFKKIDNFDKILQSDKPSRKTDLQSLKAQFSQLIDKIRALKKLPKRFVSLQTSISTLISALEKVKKDVGLADSAVQLKQAVGSAVEKALNKLLSETGSFAEQQPLELYKQMGGKVVH